ncbi:MAG: YibE/F family protein [Defluviitaleaceae bacterium]|nr:YibE/F family protein [Defluviitaleaceae bacterium]
MEKSNKTFYICVLILSAIFLFVGNRFASGERAGPDDVFTPSYYTGVVTRVIERVEDPHGIGALWFETTYLFFEVRLTGRGRRGEIIAAEQHITMGDEREISVGDRILLIFDDFNHRYIFTNHVRINAIMILSVVFLALVILFGRKKGFNAIVALGFTCLAVFLVFVPAILSGRNIYITTFIVCLYAIVSTLMLVVGPNKKALSAMLGCLGGVLLAGALMFVMDIVLNLTGVVDHETHLLLILENHIDLRALIFAGVIIGAVGAIMDVAMSISSSLWEVHQAGAESDFASLFKSGINIGKDILGTMLNTLILAYIGSSLSLILVIFANATSMAMLFNMEMIIVEFLRALVGSFGMFLTIPLTAGICGWLYTREGYDEEMGF